MAGSSSGSGSALQFPDKPFFLLWSPRRGLHPSASTLTNFHRRSWIMVWFHRIWIIFGNTSFSYGLINWILIHL
ncbi:hypothetical protein RchiOBHm_Chr1g0357051 [Rosa chinensis]|uniref:Uncharacterized protein n=1 Tax=Rosa chinensis TaxID=74649 RepID=A0A2P6SHW2_ROSCH|nr:hypothetical protein RchiOBHm_Chr1g0357051 [Rosa chinensis]